MAETIDRVVASVGNIAITRSAVETQLRFENFLDGKPAEDHPGRQQLDQARERLIQQTLLMLEAEAERIKAVDAAGQAAQILEQVRKMYPDERAYLAGLSATGLSEEQALQRLARHARTLRLIEQRLKPNAWIERPDIEAYYQGTFVPEYLQRNPPPIPALDEVETQIREILVQQKVDELLTEWLKEIEANRQVRLYAF